MFPVKLSAAACGLCNSLQTGTPLNAEDGKAPVLTPQEAAFHLPGTFSTGVKTSDVYTEGNISLVVPLWSRLGTDGTQSLIRRLFLQESPCTSSQQHPLPDNYVNRA